VTDALAAAGIDVGEIGEVRAVDDSEGSDDGHLLLDGDRIDEAPRDDELSVRSGSSERRRRRAGPHPRSLTFFRVRSNRKA